MNVKPNPAVQKYFKDRQQEWRDLYFKQGLTLRQIAEQYDVHIGTVHKNINGQIKSLQ